MTSLLSVLVVSGGGFQGQGLLKALRESSRIRIVLADCTRDNVSRHFADRSRVVPEIARGEEFLSALLDVCAHEDVSLVMPATGYELRALAQARDRFRERGVWVAVSDQPFLSLVADKGELYPALARAGLPVLPVVEPGDPKTAFPLIAKPRAGWGSRGVSILMSAADLAEDEARAGSHVFQPYLEGALELSADFAIDFQGVASPVGLRRRVRTSGGFAVISETVSHPAAESAVQAFLDLARGLGARGVMNVQLLTRGSEVYISDVNPRPGTSAVHWCGTGFNPALHVCASVMPGIRVERVPVPVHRRSVRYLEDLRLPDEERGSAIRGVVFDLDDTLIPQKRWIVAKVEAVHDAHSGELPERADFLREAQRLLEERSPSRLFDEIAAIFDLDPGLRDRLLATYRAARPPVCEIFPDVLPTLATLGRLGVARAVLTDNPPESQRAKIEASPLLEMLDVVVYAREAGGEKPDPRGFAEVSARLGLEPADLAMVGDNPYRDLWGAFRAGFGRLFLLRRPGSLTNFDPELFRRLPGPRLRFEELDGLPRLTERLG